MIGSPDEVRDRLQEYLEATGYHHVLLLMALPGLGTAEAPAIDALVRGGGTARDVTAAPA